jgi:hypothetical protein
MTNSKSQIACRIGITTENTENTENTEIEESDQGSGRPPASNAGPESKRFLLGFLFSVFSVFSVVNPIAQRALHRVHHFFNRHRLHTAKIDRAFTEKTGTADHMMPQNMVPLS